MIKILRVTELNSQVSVLADQGARWAVQCCSLSLHKPSNQNGGLQATIAMLKISRKNLRIRSCGLTSLFVLFVMFLTHPGRFSLISVSSVPKEMIEKSKLTFCDNNNQSISDASMRSNMIILNQIHQELYLLGEIVTDLSVTGGVCGPGGSCHPDSSRSLPKVTVVVPFRDREEHLAIFLPFMHNFLQRQRLNYTIVIVNQLSKSKFNRAKLMNIGYDQVMKRCPECSCFIFHDVDLIPIIDENLYACLEKPRHM